MRTPSFSGLCQCEHLLRVFFYPRATPVTFILEGMCSLRDKNASIFSMTCKIPSPQARSDKSLPLLTDYDCVCRIVSRGSV